MKLQLKRKKKTLIVRFLIFINIRIDKELEDAPDNT
jgi:hypothetical protein